MSSGFCLGRRQDEQQGGDGEHGDGGRDEDGAGGAFDVGIVLAGDYEDVGGDREGRAQGRGRGPEGVDIEDEGGGKEDGGGVNQEFEHAHVGDFGDTSGDAALGEGGAEGEQGA